MRRITLALVASASLVAVAYAQTNNSNTWTTPGNQTVGGSVQLCPRASDNVAVPCNNTGAASASGGYPAGAVPITATATGTTGATNATLAGAAAKFTYICGYQISVNASGSTFGTGAITAIVTGNFGFNVAVPAAPAVNVVSQTFTPCIPTATTNSAIVIGSPAAGAGGSNMVYAWGYQL
jgi:hypothetical protein